MSGASTGRLIVEGVVENLKIFRIYKQNKAQEAKEKEEQRKERMRRGNGSTIALLIGVREREMHIVIGIVATLMTDMATAAQEIVKTMTRIPSTIVTL